MITFTYTNPNYTTDDLHNSDVCITYNVKGDGGDPLLTTVLAHFESFLKSMGYYIPPGSRVDIVSD
jgi:hypothetical protein